MQYSYVILDDNSDNIEDFLRRLEEFPDYYCVGTAQSRAEAVNLILEKDPELVFINISSKSKSKADIDLGIIYELYRYLNELPYFVILSDSEKFAFESLKLGVFDYLLTPIEPIEMRKTLLKFQKVVPLSGSVVPQRSEAVQYDDERVQAEQSQNDLQKSEIDIQICIKSYGDYQFIALKDVVYLQADNNTTDFHLQNGKKLTAYKTLKHYENNLPSSFYRVHNSYIVNSGYVSRINTGKSLCYLNNNDVSVPFSKTFKDSIDTIIRTIAPEYL